MNWDAFVANVDDARKKVWVFAQKVLEARSKPRGPTHTFVNLAVTQQFVNKVITTNVDGLEVMDNALLANDVQAYRILFSSLPAPWIGAKDSRIAYLHGNICVVACSSCWDRHPLTAELAELLVAGTAAPCERCSGGRTSRAPFWRPDIVFYGDPREELMAEHQDDAYPGKPLKKRKTQGTTGSVDVSKAPQPVTALEQYHATMATQEGSSAPTHMFVIGSSLRNKQLSQDIISLSSRGTEVILVNPQYPVIAKKLPGSVIWIQCPARTFSERMLLAMSQ
jgi:hypothetical protein